MNHVAQVRSGGGCKTNLGFFADVIFAKGMQLKINTFLHSFFCSKTTPCARKSLFSQIINIRTIS